MSATELIPLDHIFVPDNRQRKSFPEAEQAELVDSIKQIGLLYPLLLRRTNKEYRFDLVAGERRFRALQSFETQYEHQGMPVPAGMAPCIVRDFESDLTVKEVELHENIIRLDLTWQERVQAIADLHELKKAKNPKHSPGMTAKLIDDKPTTGDYASVTAYREVQSALLVKDFMEDDEVKKARTLRDAKKVVSRKIELEAMERLRKMDEEMKSKAASDPPPEPKDDYLSDIIPETTSVVERIGTLLEGDFLELINTIPDESFSVICTDPPYGQGVARFNDGGNSTQKHSYSEENWWELHETLITNLNRICKQDAHLYLFCDIDNYHQIRSLIGEQEGWWVRRKPLIWDKGNAGKLADGTKAGWRTVSEFIIHARRGSRVCSSLQSDILRIPDVKFKNHAAEKPKELYEALLGMSSVPGDKVFDPFAGSGTIFRAARSLMLKPVGIEMNPNSIELCKMAQMFKVPPKQEEDDSLEDLLP